MIGDEKYPDLHQFLGGYFHQDWTRDHSTSDDVIRSFIDNSTATERSHVVAQLHDLLSVPDPALGPAVLGLGGYYDPTPDGQTLRQWLEALADTLASET